MIKNLGRKPLTLLQYSSHSGVFSRGERGRVSDHRRPGGGKAVPARCPSPWLPPCPVFFRGPDFQLPPQLPNGCPLPTCSLPKRFVGFCPDKLDVMNLGLRGTCQSTRKV